MRKLLTIGIPLVLPLLVLLGILAASLVQPRDWEPLLDQYLAFKDFKSALMTTISIQATLPEQFSPEMSQATYTNGPYFESTFYLDGQSKTLTPGGRLPITDPPVELWCVWLQPTGNSGNTSEPPPKPRLIYLAKFDS
ncbi:MAG: hypothetical protein EHM70_23885, partial [Chloroflexota bacterium]